MSAEHQARGKKVLTTGAIVLGLCVLAFAMPAAWLDRIGGLFGTNPDTTSAFSTEVAAADDAVARGEQVDRALEAYVLARRLTRAGPMTAEEVDRAVVLWREVATLPEAVDRIATEFPRLDRAKVAAEVEAFRSQTEPLPPGSSPATACEGCHRKTLELPSGATFDVAGIYPHGASIPEFAGGRRVPLMSEAIELEATASRGDPGTCLDCHSPHDRPDFAIERPQRIENMGLWVTTEPSDPNVLHVRVKLQNNGSGHLAPAGAVAPAYVVVVEARQHKKPLDLRFGSRLPAQLRSKGTAGTVFARDFRDAAGKPTSNPDTIATMVADTRLESGRFVQLDFVFDRVDRSKAHLEVTLWHLPDVTTWKGAKAIRRADKPES